MKPAAKTLLISIVVTCGLAVTLWFVSQWWEKAFATKLFSQTTADGCFRLEKYEPYWILPNSFHPDRSTSKRWNPLLDWYVPWFQPDLPRFYRIYDNRTGVILVQTEVYDHEFYTVGDALWTNEWYIKLGGSPIVRDANDMDLPCVPVKP